ncbi:MAG: hypothetical protein IT464_05205 [Planctomycetes bacterium]|nr:hypothetical protein [Planctomycetota bacterium]
MNLLRTIVPAFIAVLLAPMVAAQDAATIDLLLDDAAKIEPGDAEAWVKLRDQIVAFGEGALPALKVAGADEKWTEQAWPRALAAEACRARIELPQFVEVVERPPGINPEHYAKFRKPAPTCVRELVHPGKQLVPMLLERWRWTLDQHAFSKGEAGKAERDALAHALLYAPGFHADTRARFALLAVLNDKALPDSWRSDAAVSYGQTGGRDALKVLNAFVDDGGNPLALREACAGAIGWVAEDAAYDAIEARLANTELPGHARLIPALVNGLGILGARLGWQARGVMAKEQGERIRENCARLLVATLKAHPLHGAFIGQQLQVVAWDKSLDWIKELSKDGENEAVRNAARDIIDPLTLTLSRYK